MTRDIEIRGGAGDFEAAVIAVVVEMIEREETERRSHPDSGDRRLPAWIQAIQNGELPQPRMP